MLRYAETGAKRSYEKCDKPSVDIGWMCRKELRVPYLSTMDYPIFHVNTGGCREGDTAQGRIEERRIVMDREGHNTTLRRTTLVGLNRGSDQ